MNTAPADVVLRRAVAPDALAAADVWLRSFAAALPTVVSPRSGELRRTVSRCLPSSIRKEHSPATHTAI